jgi:hypothetical protein
LLKKPDDGKPKGDQHDSGRLLFHKEQEVRKMLMENNASG